MSTEKQKIKPDTNVSYYGKKQYVLNPAIARVKPPKDQGELFSFEDIDEKERMD